MTSQTGIVALSVHFHVQIVLSTEFLHHFFDVLHASRAISHGQSGVVGVATRSIPISEQLWLEADNEAELFSASHEEIS